MAEGPNQVDLRRRVKENPTPEETRERPAGRDHRRGGGDACGDRTDPRRADRDHRHYPGEAGPPQDPGRGEDPRDHHGPQHRLPGPPDRKTEPRDRRGGRLPPRPSSPEASATRRRRRRLCGHPGLRSQKRQVEEVLRSRQRRRSRWERRAHFSPFSPRSRPCVFALTTSGSRGPCNVAAGGASPVGSEQPERAWAMIEDDKPWRSLRLEGWVFGRSGAGGTR